MTNNKLSQVYIITKTEESLFALFSCPSYYYRLASQKMSQAWTKVGTRSTTLPLILLGFYCEKSYVILAKREIRARETNFRCLFCAQHGRVPACEVDTVWRAIS